MAMNIPLGSGAAAALPRLRRPSLSLSTSRRSISASSSSSSTSFSSSIADNDHHNRRLKSFSYLHNQNQQRWFKLKALDSDVPNPVPVSEEPREAWKQWDWWTATFAAGANLPFLLLQLPQIVLNYRNLVAGNKLALLALPWLGILTGMLGNLSLLSYFVTKRESEAALVQTLGVISMYIVISQLALADAMPLPYYAITSSVVAIGLVCNLLNYLNVLPPSIWRLWQDFTTIGGLSVLPQVMWSTFAPYLPNSVLPGSISFVMAVAAVVMARMGKLSEKGIIFVSSVSAWTATLLFMWMPVAQFWTNFLNPENIKGLSAISMLLAMIGNGLLIPRAIFIRDFMWFNSISKEFFFATTAALFLWIGMAFWKDKEAYGYDSPLRSLKELLR
ncbi:hypothetical protein V2J09_013816 [Rumex salicifolius]